jgi:hypothetical protein
MWLLVLFVLLDWVLLVVDAGRLCGLRNYCLNDGGISVELKNQIKKSRGLSHLHLRVLRMFVTAQWIMLSTMGGELSGSRNCQ